MNYIVETVVQQDSKNPSGFASRRIIGEATSINSLCELLSEGYFDDAQSILVRCSDVELSDEALTSMLAAQGGIDRNAIVVPRFSGERESLERIQVPFDVDVPAPEGACALLRSDIYRRYGPFDDGQEGIGAALVNFGIAINDAGFSTVIANDAVAFVPEPPCGHDGPFAAIDKHRYLGSFLEFAETASMRKPKLLFDFHDMPPFYCGTSEYQMALIRHFKERFSDEYELTIRCNLEAVEFHDIASYGFDILSPDEAAGLFDIGLVAAQPTSLEKQFFLNDHCLRIVYTMLDCILLRSDYLRMENPDIEDVARCGLRNCDGVIAISEFSRRDYLDYFSSDPAIQSKDSQVVYISTDFGNGPLADITSAVPFEHYDLVIGNTFKHKALTQTLDAVANSARRYVFVGLAEGVPVPANVVAFPNMKLDESFLDALYEHCDCVIFPSQYEGFGLPITIALRHGKKVIVCDNDLNRELKEHFQEVGDNLLFFSSFDEIPKLSAKANSGMPFRGKLDDSWSNAIVEVEAFLKRVLSKPVDWFFIDQRQWEYRLLKEEMRNASNWVGFKYLIWKRFIKGHSLREKLYRRFVYKRAGAEGL